jgi:hypothetical protein
MALLKPQLSNGLTDVRNSTVDFLNRTRLLCRHTAETGQQWHETQHQN